MASHFGFEHSQPFPRDKNFQNGNSRDHTTVSTTRGMGHLSGFQRHILSNSHSSEIQKIPEVSFKQGKLSVQSSSLWFGNGPIRIHQTGYGSEADGSGMGYPDPPVARRLVTESSVPGNLPTRYPDPLGPLPRIGLGGKLEEVGVDSSTGFQLRRLPVRPEDRSGSTDPGPVVGPKREVTVPKKPDFLRSPSVHVSDRSPHCNGEAGVVRSSSHETHPMAFLCPSLSILT